MLFGRRDRSDSWQKAKHRRSEHHRDTEHWSGALGRIASYWQLLPTDHDATGVRLHRPRRVEQFGSNCGRQRRWTVGPFAIAALLLLSPSCSHDPRSEFARIQRVFEHGDLIRAQDEAEKACHYYSGRDVQWWWRFRILKARILGWRGMYEDVLDTLETKSAVPLHDDDWVLQRDILAGAANAHLHHFSEAQVYLD